jgi:hypothetical protein
MISSEVQRTLVKSPPELWAEISDPESLARHLGEFGEIRITRVQPEQKVEWEADAASGTVVIKPSGWGTKVRLTVTRELTEAEHGTEEAIGPAEEQPSEQALEPSASEQQTKPPEESLRLDAKPSLAPPAAPELEPEPQDAEPELTHEAELDDAYEESGHEVEPEPEPQLVAELEPEERRGFFARLFGRRRTRNADPTSVARTDPAPAELEQERGTDGLDESAHELADQPVQAPKQVLLPESPLDEAARNGTETEPRELGEEQAQVPSTQAIETPDDSLGEDETAEAADPATELAIAEELAAAEVTAVLTGVLDRLGAAHHRPFSRA